MTKKVIINEIEILKKLNCEGIAMPLDLNDIKAVMEYVEDLEKQVNNYNECLGLIVHDLREHDYIHIIVS